MAKIEVTLIGNRGYIFSATDYIKLRADHRILGKLIGCVVSCPRNSTVNGLPAILSIYELCLLHDIQAANVVHKVGLAMRPTEAQAHAYQSFRERCVDEQKELLRQNKVAESRKVIDKIVAGKLKKLAESNDKQQSVEPATVLQEIYDNCSFSMDNALLQIPTQHPVDVDKTAALLHTSVRGTLKYRVFKDLWERGRYLTAGDTFGGDFLVYPGDPMFYHASHIVHCLDGGPTVAVTASRLAACGRLSVLVNKFCVFAYLDGEDCDAPLVYQTMEWQGNA